jgi:hypothetical protein
MASPAELPQLVGEFVDLSKEYLRQETLEPAKQLGRYAGFSIAAAMVFAMAGLFLGIAGVRGLIAWLPEGPNWSGLGYVVGAAALAAIGGLVVYATGRSTGGVG